MQSNEYSHESLKHFYYFLYYITIIIILLHWQGAPWMPPPRQNSFILMQFSSKFLLDNIFSSSPRGLAPPICEILHPPLLLLYHGVQRARTSDWSENSFVMVVYENFFLVFLVMP